MELKKVFINDYYSIEFKTIFKEYFSDFGMEISYDCEVFDDITKAATEEGQETLAYVNKENNIVAFLMFQVEELESESKFFKEKVGFIREFYVKKDIQRNGLGSRLLKETIDYLKSKDIHKLLLTYDIGAEEFYKKNGFLIDKSYIAENNEKCMIKLI